MHKSPFERLLQQQQTGKTPVSVGGNEQWYTPRSENVPSNAMIAAAAAAIPPPAALPPPPPPPSPVPQIPPQISSSSSAPRSSAAAATESEFDEFYPAASYVAASRRYMDYAPPPVEEIQKNIKGSDTIDFGNALLIAGMAGLIASGLLFFLEPPMVHESDPQNPMIKTDVDLRKIGMWGMGVFASVLLYRIIVIKR